MLKRRLILGLIILGIALLGFVGLLIYQKRNQLEAVTTTTTPISYFAQISDASGRVRVMTTVEKTAKEMIQWKMSSNPNRWVVGPLVDPRPKTSPYDSQWHWYFKPDQLATAPSTIEVIQTTIAGIETNLDYWLKQMKRAAIGAQSIAMEPLILEGTIQKAQFTTCLPYTLVTTQGTIFYLTNVQSTPPLGQTVKVTGLPTSVICNKITLTVKSINPTQ